MKQIVYIDMDDTIADFLGSKKLPWKGEFPDISAMYEPGFFRDLKPIDGALVAVRAIIDMGYDVWILTQPVAESPHCYAEKVQWIGMWFPELVKKICMVQDKGLARGDFLIDDNAPKWREKFEKHGGKFIHFQYHKRDHKTEWSRIVKFLEEAPSNEEER